MDPIDVDLPPSVLAQQTLEYARTNLPEQTFNHSMRVFYYAFAILSQHLPEYPLCESLTESLFIACLLHDIGLVPANQSSTRLSLELQGAIMARDVLRSLGATDDQAELVAEVVNRHQDLGETGMVPLVLALILRATQLDYVGEKTDLVHPETVRLVTTAYPRRGWSSCCANAIRTETGTKPWSHTTVLENFAEMVEANEMMAPYD